MDHIVTCFSNNTDALLWEWELTADLYERLDKMLSASPDDPERVLCYPVSPEHLYKISGVPHPDYWSYYLEPKENE